VPKGRDIEGYSRKQLQQMVEWVRSDGRLRTNEEIVDEVAHELGFQRIGRKIHDAIWIAIQDLT
jgi:hypothetical protein